MRIRIIPFDEVDADVAAIKASQDTSHPSSRSQRFSTASHHLSEITPIVPESPTFQHSIPPWAPYAYTLWHPFVARSQRMQTYYVFRIPSFLFEDLMRCHAAWLATSRIHTSLLEEVVESWTATRPGKEVAKLLDGRRKWFIRLDQMSPKDSPLGGKDPTTTLEEVVKKLCSSMRAYGCLQREQEDAKKEGREMVLKLVLNHWNEDMDAAREFRCFVPPPLAHLPTTRSPDSIPPEDLRISAISQYRWVLPFVYPVPDLDLEDTAKLVYAGAQKILKEILEFAEMQLDREVWDKAVSDLVEFGLSLDVLVKEDGEVQLVEINPFGALSGCGACLLNWVMDGRVLYGLEKAEFVVTLEGTEEYGDGEGPGLGKGKG